MKKWTRNIFLLLVMSIAILFVPNSVALASSQDVSDAINNIVNVYPNSCSYFTSDGKADSNSQDPRCSLVNIPARGGLPSGKTVRDSYGGNAWSCHAFAEYVWYILYGHCTNTQATTISASELQVGDFMRFYSGDGEHSAIYLGEDSKNYYVYDSNWSTSVDNKVRYNHTISKPKKFDVCYHATNYPENVKNEHNPFGHVDSVESTYEGVRVSGWAIDMDAPNDPVEIHIYVGGAAGSDQAKNVYKLRADQQRGDVAEKYPGTGENHGFNGVLDIDGPEILYIYLYNIGSGENVLIDTPSVAGKNHSPFGHVDSVESTYEGVKISGWAVDMDVPNDPIEVHIYVGGAADSGQAKNVFKLTADKSRGDVAQQYPGAGENHGFEGLLDITGTEVLYVYLYNVGRGENVLIDTPTVTGKSHNPVGSIDDITSTCEGVKISGWVLDGDALTEPLDIHIYVGGAADSGQAKNVYQIKADIFRKDLEEKFSIAGGNHGYSAVLDIPEREVIYIYAINKGSGENTLLGVSTVSNKEHIMADDFINQKDETCTENGYSGDRYCSACKKILEKGQAIPATGHQHTELRNVKEATDTEDGYTGDTYCMDCGAKLSSGKKIDKLVSTIDQGACGTNIKWQLNSKGVLTISGTGAMKNYTYKSEMPWYKYINDIQSVVIEDGVTSIGDYAFYGMLKLTTISIPEGVKTIGEYVFKNCTALDGVNFPSTLTKLGQSAFYGCTSLSSIAIPEGLYTVWGYTFKNCTSLEEVTLPSTLIKIDEAAFYGCSSLKKIDIPDNVSIIGIYCFKNCSSLSEVSLPKKLTQIREAVLYGTAIKTLEIPEGVTTVGPYAFKNCTSLKTIKLPQSLKKIDEAAFYACNHLSVLNVPENVETIGNYALRSCEELQSVSFPESLRTIGESSFYGCSSLSELVIPEGVTSLGGYAFKSCVNIYEVTLPTTLETIGESAFYGCSRISSITIPEYVAKIGAYAFSRCSGLAEVIFTGNAPSIGDYAFARVTADAIYPGNNSTWTKEKLQDYGGKLTWISDEGKSIAEETMETEETIAETVETENDTVYETEVPETVQEETTEERQQTEETVLETEQETDVTEIEEVVTESIDE